MDDPWGHQLLEHRVAAEGFVEPELLVGGLDHVQQSAHPGGGDLHDAVCPAGIRCAATAFNNSTSASVWADPRCSMSRDPWRYVHTTCTAAALDEIRTIRTYVTDPPLPTRRWRAIRTAAGR